MTTELLYSPPSSSSSPSVSTPTHNATLSYQTRSCDEGVPAKEDGAEEEEIRVREGRENDRREPLSLLALLVALFRKGFWVACKADRGDFSGAGGGCTSGVMDISWPTDVQHVNHVTFDRFDGFLGLPVEFEPEVPRRAPSASASVFGVSTESMQMSYDLRGNSVPSILLLMQSYLYSQEGLRAEGIFRVTAGNGQEEFVRNQLNRGVVPRGIDVHCLAGLIKAWFRELPRGVLDSVSPEQVMQCQSEENCDALVRQLPQTEAALLDWAINLMADVVQEEHLNKMNARNIAMVFAPNMTQMADPLTALMYAVQVMNFLKTLIEKTLRERKDSVAEPTSVPQTEPSDDYGNQSSSQLHQEKTVKSTEETLQDFMAEDCGAETSLADNISDEDYLSYSNYTEESDESGNFGTPAQVRRVMKDFESKLGENMRSETSQSSDSSYERTELRIDDEQQDSGLGLKIDSKCQGICNMSRIDSTTEWFEGWRWK